MNKFNKIYRSRAPLRLSFGGGGTDVDPYARNHGGMVINATIDMHSHAILEISENKKITFIASDLGKEKVFDSTSEIPVDNVLRIHCEVYNTIVRDFLNGDPLSFTLTTFSDAMPGSGLGTSSTMVVTILKVFDEWLKLDLSDYQLADLAYKIEREYLGIAGGKQDQYSAVFGGFNFMEFGPGDRVLVNPLRLKKEIIMELESYLVLYSTGRSRDSGKIIEEQKNNLNQKHTDVQYYNNLKQYSVELKESLLRGDYLKFACLINQSWNAKKELAKNVTNSKIDNLYDFALLNGAIAGKISGAGGGGMFMLVVRPENKLQLISKLNSLKGQGQVERFHFSRFGAESWAYLKNILG